MDVLVQCQTVIIQLPSQNIVYEWLFRIHDFYRPIHTYVSIIMCLVGTLCNFCNIVVLTRKQMRTPVNIILTAMACCDTVVLFSNLIYTTHYTFVAFANCHPKHWSYGWAMFLIAHAHLSLVGHSSSVWLSVMLAFIRYLTLRRREKMTGVQIDLRHSYVAIAAVVIFVTVMNTPNFMTYKIMKLGLNETCVITDESVKYASAYVPGVSNMAVEASCLVFRMAFWISGTVFKVVPCVLLTLLVHLLTRILKEVKANRQRLLLQGASSRAAAPIAPEISTTSNTLLSVAAVALSTANSNCNTAAPSAMPTQSPTIAFNSNSSSGMNSSLSSRRHSSYDPLSSVQPQLLSINGQYRRQKGSTRAPPRSPTNIVLAKKCAMAATVSIAERLSSREHTLLKRSNSAKATVGALNPARLHNTSGPVPPTSRTDRTTRMLLMIVCLFLITEFPQGIMAVLSGFFSEEYRRYIYNNVGDILDLLSLFEACTSFTIYCSMSGQFRNEFRRVFIPLRVRRWLAENSRYVNHYEHQRNSLYPCSDTYGNHSRSGLDYGGNGGAENNTPLAAASPNSSPFLRPTSSFSVRGESGVDTTTAAARRAPLSEQRERRAVTINLIDFTDRRSASPSLATVNESDDAAEIIEPLDNRLAGGGAYCSRRDSSILLNSPMSPDIPLIYCSDWSDGSAKVEVGTQQRYKPIEGELRNASRNSKVNNTADINFLFDDEKHNDNCSDDENPSNSGLFTNDIKISTDRICEFNNNIQSYQRELRF